MKGGRGSGTQEFVHRSAESVLFVEERRAAVGGSAAVERADGRLPAFFRGGQGDWMKTRRAC